MEKTSCLGLLSKVLVELFGGSLELMELLLAFLDPNLELCEFILQAVKLTCQGLNFQEDLGVLDVGFDPCGEWCRGT